MKNLLYALLFLPFLASAQTKADYEKAMVKFRKYYNQKNGAGIVKMFEEKYRKDIAWMWSKTKMDTLQNEYGKLVSFKYIGADPKNTGAIAYSSVFSKIEPNHINILLNKNKFFETFILVTSEPIPLKKKGKVK